MFNSTKNITAIIDKEIGYVLEAKENHNVEDNEYVLYLSKMEVGLKNRLEALKRISSNDKLIVKYEKKINELFN